MAEAGAGLDIRRLLLVGGVIAVILFAMLFFLFRSCVPAVRGPGGFTVVYSNLDLKDAANVIARLKELDIKYEIREDGRAIAVPKDKADEARLALAEKNLPAGGVVGWEIFDESKLGATDFDRRIQLIRAISGELSRTIRRIEGVEDVRVQIVIPETRLFAASVVPVTASVMLRLQPGAELSSEKINGVVHLVASSVENLQPENVTVIDDTGRILTAKLVSLEALAALAIAELPSATSTTLLTPKVVFASGEAVTAEGLTEVATLPVQTAATAETVAAPVKPVLTVEEKIMLRVQAKKELERDLAGKAQEILNRFYPPNSSIVKINIDFKGTSKGQTVKTKEINGELKIAQVTTIILIDNRLEVKKSLKEATYKAVAAAIGYNKKRGDRIVLQKVPFHLATTLPEALSARPATLPPRAKTVPGPGVLAVSGALVLVLGLAFWLFRNFQRSGQRTKIKPGAAESVRVTETAQPQLEGLRSFAENNPEQIAELLRNWLTE